MRIFGATAYYNNKTDLSKCEDRAIKGILVGFESSGYKIYNPETKKITVSKDVTFDESKFVRNRPALSFELEPQSDNKSKPPLDGK